MPKSANCDQSVHWWLWLAIGCGAFTVLGLVGEPKIVAAAAPRTNIAESESPPTEYRTWSDTTGRFKVEAELVDADDKAVHLRKRDGKVITVPIERISAADQRWLNSRARQRRVVVSGDNRLLHYERSDIEKMEAASEKKALALIPLLEGEETSFDAQNQLRRFRPLPGKAGEALLAGLDSRSFRRRRLAATLLAYHQFRPDESIPALRAALAAEKGPPPAGLGKAAVDASREIMQAAIDHLELRLSFPPTLAASGKITSGLHQGTALMIADPEWRGVVAEMSVRGASSKWYFPNADEIPPRVKLVSSDGPSASVGWKWRVIREGFFKIESRPAPIGAIMRLHGPLAFDETQLAAGTLLMSTPQGWGVVSRDAAADTMKKFTALQQALDGALLDYREIGKQGRAVLEES